MLALVLSSLTLQCTPAFEAALSKALRTERANAVIVAMHCETRELELEGAPAVIRWRPHSACSRTSACPEEARVVAMLIVEAQRSPVSENAQRSPATAEAQQRPTDEAPPPAPARQPNPAPAAAQTFETAREPTPPQTFAPPERLRLQVSLGMSAHPLPANESWFPELAAVSAGAMLPGNATAPSGHPFSSVHPLLELDVLYRLTERRLALQTGVSFGLPTAMRDDRVTFGATGSPRGGVAVRLGAHAGLRLLLLTERWRPYALAGVRLDGFVYTTNMNALMPTPWKLMPGVYGGLGLEVALTQAWSLTADVRYSALIPVGFGALSQVDARVAFIYAL